jgi:hypothetical protein
MFRIRDFVMGRWWYFALGFGLVAVAAGAFLFWRGSTTTVVMEFAGPPGLNYCVKYTVDGQSGTITGPVPGTVTIRGQDIFYRIGKSGDGELRFQVTVDGETGVEQTLQSPGGSQQVHLAPRRFWWPRGKTYAKTMN